MVKSQSPSTESEQINIDNLSQSQLEELETVVLDVSGMKCAGCVKAVERQLEQNNGVVSACVNLITEVAVVEYQAQSITAETLADKLTQTGFPSQPRASDRSIYQLAASDRLKRERSAQQQVRQLITAGVLLFFSSIGHLHHLGLPYIPVLSNIWIHFALATLALLIPGRSLLVDGWRSLTHGMPNMNTLVGLGTTSAYLASCLALFFPQLGWECFFDEPVMLLGFILLGRTLEGKARNRASAALENLVSLQPPIARLVGKQEGEAIAIPVDRVKLGEWLRVLPGEKIPVDGKIIAGETTVDESMLTGESVAVAKTETALVYAGTINQSGVITLEVTGMGRDTTLAKIISLVEDAQTRKAPVQQLADTIAGYFAYGVMAIASLTFIFWYLYGTKTWDSVLVSASHTMTMPMGQMTVTTSPLLLSLKLAIAVLVIACPCALGLATPTAILVGTSLGAEKGILIKGGDILERMQQLDTLVFDKTGTLTQGKPQVTDLVSFGELTLDELLQLAASVENSSNHPLAVAIMDFFATKDLDLLATTDFQSETGKGISALVEQQQIFLGNEQYLQEQGIAIATEIQTQVPILAKTGKTIIYLATATKLEGIIAIQDQIRDTALDTIKQLQNLGLEIVLLTGDRPEVARAVAQQLGIERVFSEAKPTDKAELICSLQQEKHTVAVVGDGINDAPALATADVGISLQGSTDVAISTADVVLMQNNLADILTAIELSRATVNKIQQNLGWALAYNIVAIPIAAGVLLPQYGLLLSPVLAAIAMASSSLIVVTNSLLLRLSVGNR